MGKIFIWLSGLIAGICVGIGLVAWTTVQDPETIVSVAQAFK